MADNPFRLKTSMTLVQTGLFLLLLVARSELAVVISRLVYQQPQRRSWDLIYQYESGFRAIFVHSAASHKPRFKKKKKQDKFLGRA